MNRPPPTPADPEPRTPGADEAPDATLGGYLRVHERPPAFEGADGHPYTVSPEVEHTGDLRQPYAGFLVFPRWAQTGAGIIGHVESDTLCTAATAEAARAKLEALSLIEVQAILDAAIRRGTDDVSPDPSNEC